MTLKEILDIMSTLQTEELSIIREAVIKELTARQSKCRVRCWIGRKALSSRVAAKQYSFVVTASGEIYIDKAYQGKTVDFLKEKFLDKMSQLEFHT